MKNTQLNTKSNQANKILNSNQNNAINDFNSNDNNNNNFNDNDKQKNKFSNIHFESKQDFEEAIIEAFREFDKDRTEFISKKELGNLMRSLGHKLSEIELEDMINEIDEDGNGLIGIKEFRNLLTKSIKDDYTINTSIEAFGTFDKYKTERISCDTLKDILLSGNGDTQFTENEVAELLESLNKDDNDDVNYRELVKNCFDIFNTEDAN